MAKSIQQLREQRNAKAREARNILDKAGDNFTADAQAQIDAVYAEIEQIDNQIKALEKQLEIEAMSDDDFNGSAAGALAGVRATDPDNPNASSGNSGPQGSGADAAAQVFAAYARGGENAVNRLPENVLEEYARRAEASLSTTADTEGGYLAPDSLSGRIIDRMKAYGGMRAIADVQSTGSGNKIPFPTNDDTAEEGEWLAQNAQANSGDMTWGVKYVGAHMLSSKVLPVPFALLQDFQYGDLEAYLRDRLAVRLHRTSNKGYTIGTGAGNNQPEGLVPNANVGVTGSLATGLTFEELVDLEHSVDPAYRMSAQWDLHDDTLRVIKKLKDGQGRPLWLPGVSGAAPAEILGYGYNINQAKPVMESNAKPISFGDHSKYMIRDAMDMQFFRFDDSAFVTKGQIGFMIWMRTDGNLLDEHAVKLLQNAA